MERFNNLTEQQLDIANIIVAAFCVVALFIFGLLNLTETGPSLMNRMGIVAEGSGGEPTPTAEAVGVLPATWTPRATSTSTRTPTPAPTNTPRPEPTQTPTFPVFTETPEPDYAATIAAAQSATPVVPPTPPPAPAPRIPTAIPAPPIPPPIPTTPPLPTATLPPTPTPQPLYVLSDLLGGADCGYAGISGTVRNRDGSPRVGVTVEVFNEFGYRQPLVTNNVGFYEAFLDSRPRADLAGKWHIRVLENGVQQSNEIIVIMNGTCTDAADVTKFVANFYRTQ